MPMVSVMGTYDKDDCCVIVDVDGGDADDEEEDEGGGGVGSHGVSRFLWSRCCGASSPVLLWGATTVGRWAGGPGLCRG